LLPPGEHDPRSIRKRIWEEFHEGDISLPSDQPLIFASYDARSERAAYIDFAAVGEPIPEMPVFLRPER